MSTTITKYGIWSVLKNIKALGPFPPGFLVFALLYQSSGCQFFACCINTVNLHKLLLSTRAASATQRVLCGAVTAQHSTHTRRLKKQGVADRNPRRRGKHGTQMDSPLSLPPAATGVGTHRMALDTPVTQQLSGTRHTQRKSMDMQASQPVFG